MQIEFGPDEVADFIGISQSDLYRADYFGLANIQTKAKSLDSNMVEWRLDADEFEFRNVDDRQATWRIAKLLIDGGRN